MYYISFCSGCLEPFSQNEVSSHQDSKGKPKKTGGFEKVETLG
jgi:hypothetical protein